MNGWRITLLLLMLPAACAQLPEIRSHRDTVPFSGARCGQVFVQGDWQYLHTIEATPPTGSKQTLLGLSQLSSSRNAGNFVIMTIEGMVLFEAQVNGGIHINRAVPPFDNPGMAEGIIDDLRLMFFKPESLPSITGTVANGADICRFDLSEEGTLDIEVHSDTDWTVRKYNRSNRSVRIVRPVPARGRSAQGLPNQMILEAPGPVGYRLRITLIEAKPLSPPFQF